MELGTTIVGAIIVALFAFPLILLKRSATKKEKLITKSLEKLVANSNGTISSYEISGECAFAIDDTKNQLFLYRRGKEAEFENQLNLNDFQCCRIVKKAESSGTSGSTFNRIERLELSFLPRNKQNPMAKWLIFDDSEKMQVAGELQLLEKWSKMLNAKMATKK